MSQNRIPIGVALNGSTYQASRSGFRIMSLSLIAFQPAIERAVEHQAVGQLVLVEHARAHREMLPLALGIGEAKVDPLDLARP